MAVPDMATPTVSLSFCLYPNLGGADGGTADGGTVDFEGFNYAILGSSVNGSEAGGVGCATFDAPLPASVATGLAIAVTDIADTVGDAFQSVTLLGATFPLSPSGGLESILTGANILTDAQAQAYYSAGGITYPSTTTSDVRVRVYNANNLPATAIAGATVSINATGAKTVYADGAGTLDAALTSTSSSGTVVFGNVTPGPGGISVTVNAPGITCNWSLLTEAPQVTAAWPGTGNNVIAVNVAPGTLVDLEFDCK
jgi:hypothetical protein